DRGRRLRLDREAKPGREAHGSEQPQCILAKALVGLADRANHARFEIIHALHRVEDPACLRVVEKRVDGEVPAPRIFSRAAELHSFRMAMIGVLEILPEGGDLELTMIDGNLDDSELLSHRDRLRKERAEL